MGLTGQKILRAIVAGERDASVLAALRDHRIHASVAEIAQCLHGKWRSEHLFALRQALAEFDFIGTQVAECDQEIMARWMLLSRLAALVHHFLGRRREV